MQFPNITPKQPQNSRVPGLPPSSHPAFDQRCPSEEVFAPTRHAQTSSSQASHVVTAIRCLHKTSDPRGFGNGTASSSPCQRRNVQAEVLPPPIVPPTHPVTILCGSSTLFAILVVSPLDVWADVSPKDGAAGQGHQDRCVLRPRASLRRSDRQSLGECPGGWCGAEFRVQSGVGHAFSWRWGDWKEWVFLLTGFSIVSDLRVLSSRVNLYQEISEGWRKAVGARGSSTLKLPYPFVHLRPPSPDDCIADILHRRQAVPKVFFSFGPAALFDGPVGMLTRH